MLENCFKKIGNIVVKFYVKMCTTNFQQPFSFMPKCGMSPDKARVKSDH